MQTNNQSERRYDGTANSMLESTNATGVKLTVVGIPLLVGASGTAAAQGSGAVAIGTMGGTGGLGGLGMLGGGMLLWRSRSVRRRRRPSGHDAQGALRPRRTDRRRVRGPPAGAPKRVTARSRPTESHTVPTPPRVDDSPEPTDPSSIAFDTIAIDAVARLPGAVREVVRTTSHPRRGTWNASPRRPRAGRGSE